MKRAMTECPHCRGTIQVTVDGNKLRLQAINVEPSHLQRLDLESRRLMDESFAAMDNMFDKVFGKRR